MMNAILLCVPIGDAAEWRNWLTEDLSSLAAELGVDYDGGEEEGELEVHEFPGTTPEAVARIAEQLLQVHRIDRSVQILDRERVSIEAPANLLIPVLITGSYGREFKRLCRSLDSNQPLRDWLQDNNCRRYLFRQVAGDPEVEWQFQRTGAELRSGDIFTVAQVDLKIYELTRPSQLLLREQARINLSIIVKKLGDYFGSPPPYIEELAQ